MVGFPVPRLPRKTQLSMFEEGRDHGAGAHDLAGLVDNSEDVFL